MLGSSPRSGAWSTRPRPQVILELGYAEILRRLSLDASRAEATESLLAAGPS